MLNMNYRKRYGIPLSSEDIMMLKSFLLLPFNDRKMLKKMAQRSLYSSCSWYQVPSRPNLFSTKNSEIVVRAFAVSTQGEVRFPYHVVESG